jgi:formylglycine-generating enzyme required for sulfatase activity
MGKFTVTTGQFRKFVIATGYRTTAEDGGGCFATGSDGQWSWLFQNNWRNPGFTQSDDHPVVCVSWNDVVEFTKWLTEQSGRIYRLPTEAEWEYAARAGTTGRNYWGNEVDDACRYANVSDLTAQQAFAKKTVHNCNDGHLYTAPVGSFEPNDFSLYDMMGNVWQWTGDWYGKYYYAKSPKNNPRGPKTGRRRVPRGGSWRSKPDYVRASMRVHPPASQTAGVGFRVISPVQ